MSNPNGTKFAADELVNIAIRGARVTNTYPTKKNGIDTGTILVADYPGRGDLGFAVNLAASGVTVERVAPAQWPPQVGDVWEDRNKSEWFAVAGAVTGRIVMRLADDSLADWNDLGEVLAEVGPMKLVRRRGWTPATETTPAEAGPVDERDARTRMVANIRALADFIEVRTDLPVPNSCRAQYSHIVKEPYEVRRAAVQRWGALVDEPKFSDDGRSFEVWFGGHERWHSRLAAYVVHTAEREPDEPVEDDQADADPEAPVPAPAAAPSIDDDAFDATVGTVPPAGRLFEGALKSPVEWLTEYPGTQILDWDGWHDKDITEPISHAEFHQRLTQCTITGPAKLPHRAPDADAASLLAESLADGAA